MTKLAYKNFKTTIINMVKKVMESISIMRGEIEKKRTIKKEPSGISIVNTRISKMENSLFWFKSLWDTEEKLSENERKIECIQINGRKNGLEKNEKSSVTWRAIWSGLTYA